MNGGDGGIVKPLSLRAGRHLTSGSLPCRHHRSGAEDGDVVLSLVDTTEMRTGVVARSVPLHCL